MNSAHQIIDCLSSDSIRVWDSMPDHVGYVLGATLESLLPNAMHFWCGKIEQLAEVKHIKGLSRLPFPVCYFEAEDATAQYRIGILAWEDDLTDDDECTGGLIALRKQKGQWIILAGLKWFDNIAGRAEMRGGDRDVAKIVNAARSLVARFLCALNCCNVKQVPHPASEALSAKRAANGRCPLFRFHTLEVEVPRATTPQTNASGGTHASPAVHLRRGHPRQFAPGRWTWVQPHVVGRGPGIVHKDYSATYTAQ